MARISAKQVQIDKANATTVGFVAVAAFIAVFSLVASWALLGQRSYQSRVIAEKSKTLKQLKANNAAVENLEKSYTTFVTQDINIIKGSATGTGDRDGDNAKIILDALPSKYDFPALATSIEKLVGTGNTLNEISGTDDEVNQAQASSKQAVEIPFQVSVTSKSSSIQDLLVAFQRSIRPIYINKLKLSGDDNNLTAEISAKTYYQPEKKNEITTKVVK